jgi:transposase
MTNGSVGGVFFRTRAGCRWQDLPEGFVNWKTISNGASPQPDEPCSFWLMQVKGAPARAGR